MNGNRRKMVVRETRKSQSILTVIKKRSSLSARVGDNSTIYFTGTVFQHRSSREVRNIGVVCGSKGVTPVELHSRFSWKTTWNSCDILIAVIRVQGLRFPQLACFLLPIGVSRCVPCSGKKVLALCVSDRD